MGTVEKHAIYAAIQRDVARMQGCHETIAWLTARPSPCTIRPDPPPAIADDEDTTAGIMAPQEIHAHH
jgi:hypothetical protein